MKIETKNDAEQENEKISKDARAMVDFSLGNRMPETPFEHELFRDIQDIYAKGYSVQFYFD